MKKLQNNFTTPEQSKRLLELGIPADSADCYYQQVSNTLNRESHFECIIGVNPAITNKLFSYRNGYTIPCWSVGRLIEIYITCIEHYTGDERLIFGQDTVRLGMIDCIIAAIEVGCDDGDIDFSKLED